MHVAELSHAERRPWKNGAGETRELLVWPEADVWGLRISVADIVVAAPFSEFPGIDRWIAVLTGDGLRLAIRSSAAVTLHSEDDKLHAFSGDDPVSCALLGSSTTDVNIMVRRACWRATITPTRRRTRIDTTARLVACFVSSSAVLRAEGVATRAASGSAVLWLDNANRNPMTLAIDEPGPRGWWIELVGRSEPDG